MLRLLLYDQKHSASLSNNARANSTSIFQASDDVGLSAGVTNTVTASAVFGLIEFGEAELAR